MIGWSTAIRGIPPPPPPPTHTHTHTAAARWLLRPRGTRQQEHGGEIDDELPSFHSIVLVVRRNLLRSQLRVDEAPADDRIRLPKADLTACYLRHFRLPRPSSIARWHSSRLIPFTAGLPGSSQPASRRFAAAWKLPRIGSVSTIERGVQRPAFSWPEQGASPIDCRTEAGTCSAWHHSPPPDLTTRLTNATARGPLGMARLHAGAQLPFERTPLDLISLIAFGPPAILDVLDGGAGAGPCQLERALHRGQLGIPSAKHLVVRLNSNSLRPASNSSIALINTSMLTGLVMCGASVSRPGPARNRYS